ncbi:cupin [Rhodanobacter sp. FW510-R12]|uniref:cupin domain-containing protein n=1 Tax=unclassified Rhodanobacter TaxID=2621553 RepID=UPI0007A9ADFD|nr:MULTISPECIES: cupin domain-containing protein [unclassified Rhodanobacter]KZC16379.1 cupin [Rhodanobacter sp. FW104-R8]KZC25414.1 cupin [Rhodanobacter sp. FW510-T8]KZC31392.1 cupin [Rhodanobacter sp. FW510-R10]
MSGPVINLDQIELQSVDPAMTPTGKNAADYDIRWGEIASRIGARKLGYNLTVVAPGKRNCPFHNHRVAEEMFFILEGSGELRYGDARYPLRAGDIIACPPGGPETAHQIINTGSVELRYLAIGTNETPDICEYPDSGKYLVFDDSLRDADDQPRKFRVLGRQQDSLDYWDGE